MTLIETKQSEYSVSFPITFNISLHVEEEEGLSTQEVLSRITREDVAEAGQELGGNVLKDIDWIAVSNYQHFKEQPNFGEIEVEEKPVQKGAE